MTRKTAIALVIPMVLAGCGQAGFSSAPPLALRSVRAASADAAITGVSVGGNGTLVTTADGGFDIYAGIEWPWAIEQDNPSGLEIKTYKQGDPFCATMLARLKALSPAPGVDKQALSQAIRDLTVGPLVMDGDWTHATLSRITRSSATTFTLTIDKHGEALHGTLARVTGRNFEGGYNHFSLGNLEGHGFEPNAFAPILQAVRLGAGADARTRAAALALLLKPGKQTPGPSED